jgi:hypothetical protein
LDDLRKPEIICFVPFAPTGGFRLQRVDITYGELHEEFDDMKHQLPFCSIVYSSDPRRGAAFSIESAREGIGDGTSRSLVRGLNPIMVVPSVGFLDITYDYHPRFIM